MLSILQAIFYYPMFNVLMFLYWLVRDFGLSIILLTLLIRAALIPLTLKQLKSQRRMMDIQPQLAALKEQYKGDQQGFAKAQMQLMKENNVSMFGGCLPLVVQLPFLYGLFYALRDGLKGSVAEINSQIYPFLKFTSVTPAGGSHPLNPYLDWFAWLPGNPALNLNLPDPTHILPILAALFTFISVRMTMGRAQPQLTTATQSGDQKAKTQQNAQSQMMGIMTYISPLFTLWFAWQYAAGLSLYWVVSTLFGVGQQFMIYGWGGLFKGVPRLEAWGKQKDMAREERRLAKRRAQDNGLNNVVEGTTSAGKSSLPTSSRNGATGRLPIPKSGATNGITPTLKTPSANGTGSAGKEKAKEGDWIDQAKAETQASPPKRKERPRPFVTLVTPQEKSNPAPESDGDHANGVGQTDEASAANGAKATNGAASKSTSGNLSKGTALTNSAKTGAPQAKRKVPPRSGTVPKPKGGKK